VSSAFVTGTFKKTSVISCEFKAWKKPYNIHPGTVLKNSKNKDAHLKPDEPESQNKS